MNILVLLGSPRKNGNTAQLTESFIKEAEALGAKAETLWLYDMNIKGCLSCRACQKDWEHPACAIRDDMDIVLEKFLWADIIVLSTPIYAWYCTAPMKAAIDRSIYSLNKFYGEKMGPSLSEGKKIAIITTCGYKTEKGADVFEEGMKRYCKHCHMIYTDMLAERFMGYDTVFMDEAKERHAREFAKKLVCGE